MEKLNQFYSDLLRKCGKLTSSQEERLRETFFPGWADLNPNERMMDSLRDFQKAFNKWEAEREAEKPLPSMTDAEIDEIAKMF